MTESQVIVHRYARTPNCKVCGRFVGYGGIPDEDEARLRGWCGDIPVCERCIGGNTPVKKGIPKNKGIKARNRKCMHCGSYRTEYRVRTKDLRCKDCRGVTPIKPKMVP